MSQQYFQYSRKRIRNNSRRKSSSSDVILLSDDEIRKERNRKASANYRKRKNDLIETLQEETKVLKQRINEISHEYENSRNKVEIILEQLKQYPANYQTNSNFMQLLSGLFKIPKPIEPSIKVKQQTSSNSAAATVHTERRRNKFDSSSQPQHRIQNFHNQRFYKYKASSNDSKNNGFYNDASTINKNIINEPIHQKRPRIRPTTLSIITDQEQQASKLTNYANPNIPEVFDSPGILFVSAFLKSYKH